MTHISDNNSLNKSDFEIYLNEKDPERQIQRINVFKTEKPEYNILVKNGEIIISTDIKESRTHTGIDLVISNATQKDWELSVWAINQLLLRFELDPLNLVLGKECDFTIEDILQDINRFLLPDPFDEFDEEDEAELIEELKKTEENPY